MLIHKTMVIVNIIWCFIIPWWLLLILYDYLWKNKDILSVVTDVIVLQFDLQLLQLVAQT